MAMNRGISENWPYNVNLSINQKKGGGGKRFYHPSMMTPYHLPYLFQDFAQGRKGVGKECDV